MSVDETAPRLPNKWRQTRLPRRRAALSIQRRGALWRLLALAGPGRGHALRQGPARVECGQGSLGGSAGGATRPTAGPAVLGYVFYIYNQLFEKEDSRTRHSPGRVGSREPQAGSQPLRRVRAWACCRRDGGRVCCVCVCACACAFVCLGVGGERMYGAWEEALRGEGVG